MCVYEEKIHHSLQFEDFLFLNLKLHSEIRCEIFPNFCWILWIQQKTKGNFMNFVFSYPEFICKHTFIKNFHIIHLGGNSFGVIFFCLSMNFSFTTHPHYPFGHWYFCWFRWNNCFDILFFSLHHLEDSLHVHE